MKKFKDVGIILKENFRLGILDNLMISIIYLMLVPVFRGISNLNSSYAADCLEKSVAVVGLILLVPLLKAEQNRSIRELIFLKHYATIIIMRVVMAVVAVLLEIIIFAKIMTLMDCKFEYWHMVMGTFSSSLALGAVGFLSCCIFDNLIVGYLVSIGYYFCNFIGVISSKNICYLFSMTGNIFYTKYLLAVFGIFSISAGICFISKVSKY